MDTLSELLQNDHTEEKMEQAILDSMNEFCYYIGHTSIDSYYNFVLGVIKRCNQVVDMYLDKILLCIVVRMSEFASGNTQPEKKLNVKQQHREKKRQSKEKVIFMECLNILDATVRMPYFIKLLPQLEPHLIEITDVFFRNPAVWDYLDDLIDIASQFIGNTQGNTSLAHIIMDGLGSLDQARVTMSTVFQLYFNLVVYGPQVVIQNPGWLPNVFSPAMPLLSPSTDPGNRAATGGPEQR